MSYNFIKYGPVIKLFFTVRISRKFVIVLSRKIPPHLSCVGKVCRYTTLSNISVLKATTDRKTTSVTTRLRRPAARWTHWTVDAI